MAAGNALEDEIPRGRQHAAVPGTGSLRFPNLLLRDRVPCDQAALDAIEDRLLDLGYLWHSRRHDIDAVIGGQLLRLKILIGFVWESRVINRNVNQPRAWAI